MAIYHYSAAVVSRAAGQSAINTLAYINKQREHDDHIDKTFDYSKKQDEVFFRENVLPPQMSEEVRERFREPGTMWNDIENFEKRDDAQLCQRINIAMPKELTREQQIALAQKFAQEVTKDGRAFTYAIHDPEQPHIDGMFTIRAWDAEKNSWGKKSHFDYKLDKDGNRILNPKRGKHQPKYAGRNVSNIGKEDLQTKRELWQNLVNDALERAGIKERVDCRTLKAQRDEQRKLARAAEKKGDLDKMLRHDLAAANLDRDPTKHEFTVDAGPRADIKEHNEIVRERNAARTSRLKKKVRDQYWSKRAKRDRQRRGRNSARIASLQAAQTDSRLSRRMQLDETHVSRVSDSLQFRPTGPAAPQTTVQAQPGRAKPSVDSLFSDSKPARAGEKIEWAIYANKAEAARSLGISTHELDRRCAVQMVQEREQERGKRYPSNRRDKLIGRIAGHMSKGDGMICVAKTGGKAANGAIKVSCKMMQATAKTIETVRGLVGAIPLVGKPLSGALAVAETPFKVTSKIGRAVTDKADKMLDDDRRDRQPARRGGGGQQQEREQEQNERGGGLPAGQLGHADDKFDWLDPCMSEMAKAEEEQKQFIRETLG